LHMVNCEKEIEVNSTKKVQNRLKTKRCFFIVN
jgi:hypothetical protein